jgi:hypothetical protein
MFRLFPCPLSPVSLRFIDAVTGAAVKHSVVTVYVSGCCDSRGTHVSSAIATAACTAMSDLMLRSYAVAVPSEVTLLKTDGDGRLQVHGANIRVTCLFVINPTPLLGFVA